MTRLVAKYPDEEKRIVRLARDDPDFRSICEEIGIAEDALARWQSLPRRAVEYEEILDRLRREFWAKLTPVAGWVMSDDSGNSGMATEGGANGKLSQRRNY